MRLRMRKAPRNHSVEFCWITRNVFAVFAIMSVRYRTGQLTFTPWCHPCTFTADTTRSWPHFIWAAKCGAHWALLKTCSSFITHLFNHLEFKEGGEGITRSIFLGPDWKVAPAWYEWESFYLHYGSVFYIHCHIFHSVLKFNRQSFLYSMYW